MARHLVSSTSKGSLQFASTGLLSLCVMALSSTGDGVRSDASHVLAEYTARLEQEVAIAEGAVELLVSQLLAGSDWTKAAVAEALTTLADDNKQNTDDR